ncbi:SUMF1/EgtB/PvdO family nonheme iron enzyme [Micrococcus sp.]|uniref:SUMF1/EgtB/PvdO family nonheme iron enzyme n=1 Tax=Micrococcus sp. TaxID=1271 RepID=UPI0026DDBE9B|nr:SUMF1/EgtB/PvdO family nonheme iron enzyme [Micrococcus sp.]MDO4239669.1 SUMF1/EgtB/PvdO family nonheme iron enzyme [Micrococcus sp.]
MRRRPMALLPSGTITLRDTRRSQTRDVALEAFEIAVSPVHARDSGVPRVPFSWFDAVGYFNELSRTAGIYEAYTVQAREVEWNTAADGYRLPTEAEWDYACRAGTTSPTYGPLEDIAWTNLDHLEGLNSGAMGGGRMRRLASTCHAAAQRAGEQVTSSVDGGTSTLQKDHGDVFEVFPDDVSRQVPRPITAWDRAVWEGAEIGPDRASAYLTEDTRGGLF